MTPSIGVSWLLFRLTEACNVYDFVNGNVLGRDWTQVHEIAEAIGEPWDQVTVQRQQRLFDAWNVKR